MDTLSHCPKSIYDDPSDNESKEYETISYSVVCSNLTRIIKGEKLPLDIKRVIQYELAKWEQLPEQEKIEPHS